MHFKMCDKSNLIFAFSAKSLLMIEHNFFRWWILLETTMRCVFISRVSAASLLIRVLVFSDRCFLIFVISSLSTWILSYSTSC
jgi:hypothetical protein